MVELGREAEDTFGQIGKWFAACHDVNKAKERAQNPPLFRKITSASSVEKEALEALIAQKKMLEIVFFKCTEGFLYKLIIINLL